MNYPAYNQFSKVALLDLHLAFMQVQRIAAQQQRIEVGAFCDAHLAAIADVLYARNRQDLAAVQRPATQRLRLAPEPEEGEAD